MPDIYGKDQTYGATNILTADVMVLRIADSEIPGSAGEYLVQNVAIQYNQPINRVFEIGSSLVFFAPGRSIGTCQIGRIVGLKAITDVIGPAGTGIWSARINNSGENQTAKRTLEFFRRDGEEGLGGETPPLRYKCTGCIVESYGIATDANGLLVQENVQVQFAGLELSNQPLA